MKEDVPRGSEFVGKKRSLFPELTKVPVAKPPEKPEAETPEPKAEDSTYTEHFNLSSRFDAPKTIQVPEPAQETPELEPVTPVETKAKTSKSGKKITLIIAAILLLLAAVGSYYIFHSKAKKTNSDTATKSAAKAPVTIPVYTPQKLPAGYTYNNDQKTVGTNVFSMSVTGPKKELFYITQQAPPVNNDFTPFNLQLTDPKTFTAPIGSITTGSKKSSFIVSIATVKNTWIIINSPNTGAQSVIQPVIDSLSL